MRHRTSNFEKLIDAQRMLIFLEGREYTTIAQIEVAKRDASKGLKELRRRLRVLQKMKKVWRAKLERRLDRIKNRFSIP